MENYIKPSFVIVGAQKCGTTSIYNYLKGHPDIFVPEIKETTFFSNSDLFLRGKDYYLSKYFKSDVNVQIAGEVCPLYLGSLNAPERIYQTLGDIKIIIILRDPIKRAYSNFLMRKSRLLEKRSFENAVNSEMTMINELGPNERVNVSPGNDYLYNSLYARHIKAYLDLFGFESICFLQFEDLCQDPNSFMKQLCHFLGSDKEIYTGLDRKYNVHSKPRSKNLEFFIRNNFRFKRHFKKLVPLFVQQRIIEWNTIPVQKEPMPERIKKKLDQFFEDENLRLTKMLKGAVNIKYSL